jgi:hypothetical protein
MKDKAPKTELQKSAAELAERIAKELRENDPAKEKAYEEDEARREAEVEKKLAAHMAKRKK